MVRRTGRLDQMRSRLKLWRARKVGENVRVIGRIWVYGGGRIEIGDRVLFDASACPIELHVKEEAALIIGDDVEIHGGTSIEATARVTIGSGVHIGPYCKVMDNHWHPLRGDRRQRPESSPVVIGDRVTLGRKVILLPGVMIGDDTRVLDASVVSRSLPPNVTAQGFPSRPVKKKELGRI